MKIEEAIEFLKSIYSDRKLDLELRDDMPGQKAIQLGIEALERIKGERDKLQDISKYDVPTIILPKWLELLPSETDRRME